MGTSKYNLEQLGWFNFEQLVRTLFRELLGPGLSAFSGSVDQGRDATFDGKANLFPGKEEPWEGSWILQVKHRTYSARGAGATRREVKRVLADEVEKITGKYHHPCDNYVFITNCPLTAADKDEMLATVKSAGPSIRNVSVIGEADLDGLLDGNPKVVAVFPQILGLSQLRELIEWGLHQRSLQFLLAAQSEIATFVATSPYLAAVDLLRKQHFCILSGPPKMGKTCTAYALAASFSASSFEILDLRQQQDFYDAYRDGTKQLFICDDVFGDISMRGSLRDDWARGFVRLLGSLGRDHKLVWTAREYILREALTSSKLNEERPTLATADKVTVAVDKLSRLEKAMILYNHARAANLPEYVREFLKSDACIEIVDHKNYSPESIRQLCTGRLVSFVEASPNDSGEIRARVDNFLSRPGEAWKTAYLAAPEGEKLLCTQVMASGGVIRLSDLRKRYETAMIPQDHVYESFDTSLTNATGTFLRRRPYHRQDDESVQFYHPTMRDLLAELIEKDKSIRVAYLKQLSLQEISTLVKPSTSTGRHGGSSEHRIRIDDKGDIELLREHIDSALLPQSGIYTILNVLTDLCAAMGPENCRKGHALRLSDDYTRVLWMILDSVVPHACSEEFWIENSSCTHLLTWRRLLQTLRELLPITGVPAVPTYVPELIERLKQESSVDFWGLVQEAHSIVPTIVEQCIDMSSREGCRVKLVEEVENALSEADGLDLESDYNDSQYWYGEYGNLSEDCEDYAKLFPDDPPIEGAGELSQLVDDYPPIEDEREYDQEIPSLTSSSLKRDDDILEIFMDL